MKRVLYTALLLLLGEACDSQNQVEDELEFRVGEPEVLYLSQNDAEVDLWGFAKIVQACADVQDLDVAITWTAYPPEQSGGGRVLGFGFSAFANDPVLECYEELMLKLGASPLP